MEQPQKEQPFKRLGDRLKIIRQKMQETMAEVSGAVEIDEPMLQRIEQGAERPSEDILMLLISHFNMQDDEAAGLWTLAGYEPPQDDEAGPGHSFQEDLNNNRAVVMVMAVDPRIVYTDGAQVTANQRGVVVTFSQGTGTSHPLNTARVGMSREQAYKVLHALQEALLRSEPRELPPGEAAAQQ